jgi:uncharacterized protein YdeI (YjbR/CyaY-like superfamily)
MAEKKSWHSNEIWEVELEILRSIIIQTQLVATNKWGGEVYTHNNKNIIGIGGFKNFFTIWFFNGVFLKDELKVLVNANEGVTKGLRQWRFTTKDEINEKHILAYINEAIANEEKGLSIQPEKRELFPSDFFASELKNHKSFAAAFQKLTPFKQREYIEYVDSAKQEKTKMTRLKKIKPMVLNGIGLNDKYRK